MNANLEIAITNRQIVNATLKLGIFIAAIILLLDYLCYWVFAQFLPRINNVRILDFFCLIFILYTCWFILNNMAHTHFRILRLKTLNCHRIWFYASLDTFFFHYSHLFFFHFQLLFLKILILHSNILPFPSLILNTHICHTNFICLCYNTNLFNNHSLGISMYKFFFDLGLW